MATQQIDSSVSHSGLIGGILVGHSFVHLEVSSVVLWRHSNSSQVTFDGTGACAPRPLAGKSILGRAVTQGHEATAVGFVGLAIRATAPLGHRLRIAVSEVLTVEGQLFT